ncbi:MAG: glycine--tRNA ligase subunit beta, partial [Pseudomonadota bacterium]|nr:glycine--tRNA ligase subunit beta [Pseudomonadota bacterium]
MSAPLLIEIYTEELPPKSLKTLAEAFAAGVENGLRTRLFINPNSVVTVFGSPRRLAVHISHVAKRAADQSFRQKLLPVSIGLDAAGKATAALRKKLAALGIDANVSNLQQDSDGKQQILIYEGVRHGELLITALQAVVEEAVAALPVAKMMSYQLADGATTTRFVRPAHRLIAMHGHAVVPVHVLGLQAGTKTFGHRFLAPGVLTVLSPDMYAEQMLEEGYVIASFAQRRAKIDTLLRAEAARHGAKAVIPDELLDEVTALVEWPVIYESSFDAAFLEVPPECLLLTMQQNQKYFALTDEAGRLTDRFLLVSNIQATDGGAAIRAGNARVVRARLADAKFFYDQDRRQMLESRVGGLANVVYHGKLGSQLQRVERVVAIALAIADELGVDRSLVERAARLCKADLRTLMVGEFPELQGVMGEYYARHDGEKAEVARAIRMHYYPRFSGDALPDDTVGTCVALADKLEMMTGLF